MDVITSTCTPNGIPGGRWLNFESAAAGGWRFKVLDFGRKTSSRWRFSQKNDWIVQVIPQQAIKAIPERAAHRPVPAYAVPVALHCHHAALARQAALGRCPAASFLQEAGLCILRSAMPGSRQYIEQMGKGIVRHTDRLMCFFCLFIARNQEVSSQPNSTDIHVIKAQQLAEVSFIRDWQNRSHFFAGGGLYVVFPEEVLVYVEPFELL
jgi:hypothetical protein